MKNIKLSVVSALLISALLLSGCDSKKRVVNNPLSEEEVIAYVQDQIYKETGDEVTAEIDSKKQLKVPAWPYAADSLKVKDAHEYHLKITSNEYNDLVASATYEDGYIVYDKDDPEGSVCEPFFSDNYESCKGFYCVKKEFTEALDERFDDYRIYDDENDEVGLAIFICSSDYELIDDLLSSFKDISIKYKKQEYVRYGVYIYKDEQVFKSTDFERFKNVKLDHTALTPGEDGIRECSGKKVTKLAFDDGFNEDFFTSNGVSGAKGTYDDVDRDSLKYYVFWYRGEPNAFVNLQTPSIDLYGVK